MKPGSTFGARLVGASGDTPEEPWLRTGDLGVISDGELFIMGRIKDLLIVYGRNHYPDDIEATIQEITGGRAAAIAVPDDRTEKLVASSKSRTGRRSRPSRTTSPSAVSSAHGLSIADLVPVSPGRDTLHDQRKGQTSGLRRAVPETGVHPLGRRWRVVDSNPL